jgi:hypothetical protein
LKFLIAFRIKARQFTFILSDSPMDDFFKGSRTDGRVSD